MQLEAKVEILAKAYAALKNENIQLKERERELLEERTRLVEKTEVARTRIETIISRLKEMEAAKS